MWSSQHQRVGFGSYRVNVGGRQYYIPYSEFDQEYFESIGGTFKTGDTSHRKTFILFAAEVH